MRKLFFILALFFSLASHAAITISPTTISGLEVSIPYSQRITPSGGAGAYIVYVSSGTLPAGTSIVNQSDYYIYLQGTPTTAATYTFSLTARDANGATGSRSYTVTVAAHASGTVTSVAVNAGTAISISGSPITSSGTITVTNTAPDRTVTITGAGTTTVSGTYPTFTVTTPGVLPIVNGGTNATTANAAFNNLAPSQTSNSGKYLTTDGSNTSWATVTSGWALTGNSGTTAGTNFLGTTDAQDLVFKRNSIEAGRFNATDGLRIISTGSTSATYSQRNLNSNGDTLFTVRSDGRLRAGNTNGDLSIGVNVGYCTTCSGNTFIGYEAGKTEESGYHSVGVGYLALNHITTGFHPTAVGAEASYSLTTGNNQTAVGEEALYSNRTGNGNTAVGSGCMFTTDGGVSNCAFGANALYQNIIGNYNTAIGSSSLQASKGDQNTAVGFQALNAEASGTGNTAVGYEALNLSNGNNYCSAFGNLSLAVNSNGSFNSAFGGSSLAANTSGSNNTALGRVAGSVNVSGSDNTYLGYNANAATTNLSNSTALGSGATINSSNSMVMGSSSVTKFIVNGKIYMKDETTPFHWWSSNFNAGVLTWTDTGSATQP